MGYRSDIKVKISRENKEQFIEILTEADLVQYFKEVKSDENYICFEANHLKWYDGYTDVKKINSFINSLEEDGGLLAIGEGGGVSQYGDCSSVELDFFVEVDWGIKPQGKLSTKIILLPVSEDNGRKLLEDLEATINPILPEAAQVLELTDFMDLCNSQELDLEKFWVGYANFETTSSGKGE